MLDCCLPISRVANEGIVLHQASNLITKWLACTLPGDKAHQLCPCTYTILTMSHACSQMCYQAACLARCNGAKVEVRQSGTFNVEEFREDVQRASQSESEHLIVSYSRKQFLQTGK